MWYNSILEKNLIPDPLIRYAIRQNCRQRLRDERIDDPERQQEKFLHFVQLLKASNIAVETKAANEQHYEVPSDFFKMVLGKHLKYSCGLWNPDVTTLDQAEEEMLALTCVEPRCNHT